MVTKMNKTGFINQIMTEANVDIATATLINDCMEENFPLGKKNKEKTINSMIEKLNVSEEVANNYYNIASSLIAKNIKEKLKHPFKSQG